MVPRTLVARLPRTAHALSLKPVSAAVTWDQTLSFHRMHCCGSIEERLMGCKLLCTKALLEKDLARDRWLCHCVFLTVHLLSRIS